MGDTLGFGRLLVILGAVLVVVGLLMMIAPKVPFIGRLPGDFSFGGAGWRIYVPLGTSLAISLILSLILWLFRQR